MPRPHVWVALFCGLLCTLIACTAPQPGTRTSPPDDESEQGASGIGDDYYPSDGNGGYDATGYDVSIRYDPATDTLDGDTTVTARATQPLSQFNLDLRGFTVSSVDVDGRAARFSREGTTELVVTPPQPLAAGSVFHTRVRYSGQPTSAEDAELGDNGWQRSPTGGAFAIGEPHSASYWYPANDHPRDKAAFELTATVPQGWSAVSIGVPGNTTTKDGWTTSTWTESQPVASYLTTVAIDRFAVERGALPDGTPVLHAFAPGSSNDVRNAAPRTGEIIAFLESRFGAYPATSAGGIYLGQDVGFSLETQGRPTYGQAAEFSTVVHELAHQWYGNSVSLESWKDICLNECLASYSEWLWAEGKQGQNLDAKYRNKINHNSDDDFWQQKLYDPGAGHEFQGVYDKGPLAMHALRRQIGDDAFNRVLREWPVAHENGNATWPQFEEFVQRVSGQDLRGFFDAWFHSTERPADRYLYPGSPR